MLSGITVTCFAASYSVVLVLEISRLFFRSGVRGAVMLGFAGAGFFAHTVYLYYHEAHHTGSPFSSPQEWYLVAAWLLTAVYLTLLFHYPKNAFGVFVLPLVLGLIAAGSWWATDVPFPRLRTARVWGMIHGASILCATVTVFVGFVAGMMYLEQANRLKKKLPPRPGLRLPSLEWLQRVNARAIVLSVITLAVAVFSGAVLNQVLSARYGRSVPWNDPFVLGTIAMFLWLIVAVAIHAFYRPAREGLRVAYLTVMSFLFLVVVLCIGLFVDTQHGPAGSAADTSQVSSSGENTR